MYECTEYLDPIYTLQGCISSIMFYDSEISHLVKVTESTAQETRTTFLYHRVPASFFIMQFCNLKQIIFS